MAYTTTRRDPDGDRSMWGRLVDTFRSFWLGEKSSSDPTLGAYFGSTPTKSGIPVNEYTALNYSAVWAAVQSISGSIASLPLFLYKRIEQDGKERYTNSRVYRLIHDDFSPEHTAMVARETMTAHVLTWGNAYAEIERNNNGEPLALWPLTPDMVRPERTPTDDIVYRVRQSNGTDAFVPAGDMLHIPGLGYDGLQGYSVIRKARESIALGLATEQFGATFFGNGAWPGLVAQHPGKLSTEAHARLKNSLNEALRGGNAHNLIVTEEGIKVDKMAIPPDDAQFLATRIFQISEIARFFNMPLHKLRELSHATFSNVEELNIDWVADTLRPWLVRWEKELDRKLIRPLERNQQFTEHLVDGLLRGKHEVRYAAYATGIQWGFLSPNDVRRFENMNPLGPEGDIYLVPLNMQPAKMVEANAQPEPAPPPAARPPAEAEPDAERARCRARLIAAHRAILVEVLGRMVRKETNALRRVLKHGPQAVRDWMDEFYGEHYLVLTTAILPAVRAHLSHRESDQDPSTMAEALASSFLHGHRERLVAILQSRPANLAAQVELEAERWDLEHPALVADRLMTEELTHALTA